MAVKGKHGAMLAGRYRLLEQLGEGGMGSVWKAEHVLLHSHVAIKLIDPEIARLEFNLARFLREAKTLAALRSPNVVQVLDFGSDSDTPYLVMELLQGQTLGRRLLERGRLSLSETTRVLADVCTAMALVHEQGLIHRDLKPENIFLCNTGEQRVTKVVDFGIAKSLRGDMSSTMKTRTGHMLGTPSYMSPEQCRGLKDLDHRADLWALGVIAYECLVGKVPFEGEVLGDLLLRICMDPLPVPSQRAKGLPNTFDAWFAKAVARDRSERFQSAKELAAALAELATEAGFGATVSGREEPEPSRPSVPRLSAPPAAAPRPPSNTETNTGVGLGPGSRGRLLDRRRRVAAIAAALAGALAGLWAIGNKRDAAGSVGVGVQSLRPPYEIVPKIIKPGVPSGRRWTVGPAGGAGTAPDARPRWAPPDMARDRSAFGDIAAATAPSAALAAGSPPAAARPAPVLPPRLPNVQRPAPPPPPNGQPSPTLPPALRGTAATTATPSRAPAAQPEDAGLMRIR